MRPSKIVVAQLVAALVSGPLLGAESLPAVTNLAGVTHVFGGWRQAVRDVRVDATVFACDTNSGVIILQDASGAAFLELDGLHCEFAPGDVVHVESKPCLLSLGDFGVRLAAAPLVNNDGLHAARTISSEGYFEAGRHPLRVEWFNQFAAFELRVFCLQTNLEAVGTNDVPTADPGPIRAARAECYEGFWTHVPNFQLLNPVKTGEITNFDIGFRTRDDLVGIRFDGYFDAPRAGKYVFALRSDDGSRLWVDSHEVSISKVGTNVPPAARPAMLAEPMAKLDEPRLASMEGRVSFVSRLGKGLRFELRSEQNSILVVMAYAGTLDPGGLLNARVRVSGVAGGVLTENGRVVLGRLAAASSRDLTILEGPPNKGILPPVLTTAMQVHGLSRDDAARQLRVAIQGVVTAVGQPRDHWMAIQDETRGVFVRTTLVSNGIPAVGDVWSVAGHTLPGDFAPVIETEVAANLGKGRMPPPSSFSWNQIVNGSMDVQWGQVEGVVTGVKSNSVSLLMSEGRQEITLPEWGESELKVFDRAVVGIRGTLFAVWNRDTHEVHSGNMTIHNGSITVERPAPGDPFDAPEKTPRGLYRFDAKATPFQLVKVRGQVTHLDAKRVFLQQGSGIQIFPAAREKLRVGDLAEAVGYPDITDAGPLLREAQVRKTGEQGLEAAALVPDAALGDGNWASTRIRVEGSLAGQHMDEDTLVLHIQTAAHLFLARVANVGSSSPWRLGSKLSLTGIYVSEAGNGAPAGGVSRFELLLNGPADVVVLSAPPWWTLERLLSAVGVLLVTLALAVVWITLLRSQVAQRTAQLQHETRERERAERQHALEAERSRIARDLHDDLGASLTEINVLASTGQRPRLGDGAHPALFRAIAEKARSLVAALDVIVWAVDPEDNSLQSLADYLSGYAREYLSSSSIPCRFDIPVTFPDGTLDGQVRHELLMVVKETLNNIVRHASATEVEFQMGAAGGVLEIRIADNGKGFASTAGAGGHGLRNHLARVTKIGGSCAIESRPDSGTTVHIRLPVPPAAAREKGEPNTTFG